MINITTWILTIAILLQRCNGEDFIWNDCANSDMPLHFYEAHISPIPVKLPGELIVNGTISLNRTVDKPLRLELEVFRQIGMMHVKIFCIDNYGSCTYEDICKVAPPVCPPGFDEGNIPCQCPVTPGYYTVPNFPVNLTIVLPSILNGKYNVIANLYEVKEKIGCINFSVGVVHNKT
ncbi:hypothetical protein GJ496_006006 [Pomphorhynchus laevis]|nr:hypothetical protein GJ496_006006 [Pomphorhynchus laevis]